MLQVVLSSFYRQINKTQWWYRHDLISCWWDLKISNFVKLNIGYYLSKFLIPWLSGSNFFTEVSVRSPKQCDYNIIYYHCVSKLAYSVEHGIGYQLTKFQCTRMSGSNFMERGRKDPPPPHCYNKIKKHSAYRVKEGVGVAGFCYRKLHKLFRTINHYVLSISLVLRTRFLCSRAAIRHQLKTWLRLQTFSISWRQKSLRKQRFLYISS